MQAATEMNEEQKQAVMMLALQYLMKERGKPLLLRLDEIANESIVFVMGFNNKMISLAIKDEKGVLAA